jgi:hypothetical protein
MARKPKKKPGPVADRLVIPPDWEAAAEKMLRTPPVSKAKPKRKPTKRKR